MPLRFSFSAKLGAALALGILAQWLFLFEYAGATLGYFALTMATMLAIFRPAARRDAKALVGLAAATGFALMLIESPSLLAALLCWASLLFAALAPRLARMDGALRWLARMALTMAVMPFGPVIDWGRWLKLRRRGRLSPSPRLLPLLALPALGSAVFIGLFALANPLIANALERLDPGLAINPLTIVRALFVGLVASFCWALLRPFAFRAFGPAQDDGVPIVLPGVSISSVTLSLIVFNLIFAVQNALDLIFLWSGAPLPGQTTMADYAHQGAYPLIATALLRGLFVIVTLRPGSETAARPAVRQLVTIWVAQNVLLVASSMLRTFDYIDAYSLTRLRIAALIWMALVAVGLVLVCARMWRGKNDNWLISANAVAALLVLTGCTAVDLGRMAAAWNVRHAREAGGHGVNLDICYLNTLGAPALLPIIELEARTRDPVLKDRLAWSRNRIMDEMEPWLTDWHGWNWRDERRFRAAEAMIAAQGLTRRHAEPRLCSGLPIPVAVAAPVPPPLTAEGNQ
jgi:hypothetical protein